MPTRPISHAKTPLFGGAITVDLPADFADVSSIRDIPDNQEVYLSRTGLTSIIVDIVERAAPPSHPCTTDEEALKYHYADIVAAGYGGEERRAGDVEAEETRTWSSNNTVMTRIPTAPAYTLLATQHPRQASSAQSFPVTKLSAPDFTAILLTLIRLPTQATDVLLTINVPHVPGDYRPEDVDLDKMRWGPLIEAALDYRKTLLSSFTIVDWELFGAGVE